MSLRDRVIDRWNDVCDRLADLEQLWLTALVTAILTIAATAMLTVIGIALSDPWRPALGFAIAALVSFVGYYFAGARRRRRLAEVAVAAEFVLDTPLSSYVHTLPEARGMTVRTLARSAEQGRLADDIDRWAAGLLADALEHVALAFEQQTVRHVERLAPPRANALVDRSVFEAREAATAARRLADAASDPGGRLLQDLRLHLERTRVAAEALEQLHDRAAFRQAEAARDGADADAKRIRLDLQERLRGRAREVLVSMTPPADALEQSTLARRDATLRDIASLDRFAFAAETEQRDVAAWRGKTGATQQAFIASVEGRGLEMHSNTHRAWVQVNDAVRQLDNTLGDLASGLTESAPASESLAANVFGRLDERRDEVLAKVRALVIRVDEAIDLEVR